MGGRKICLLEQSGVIVRIEITLETQDHAALFRIVAAQGSGMFQNELRVGPLVQHQCFQVCCLLFCEAMGYPDEVAVLETPVLHYIDQRLHGLLVAADLMYRLDSAHLGETNHTDAQHAGNLGNSRVDTAILCQIGQRLQAEDGMVVALEEGDLEKVTSYMENVLETVTVKLYPEIEEIKTIMKEQGALNSLMSGSGPTVFGIYRDDDVAKKAASYIKELGLSKEIFVTTPV